ncbi:hypothetical protein J6590_052880 [Homalodisca vitripennis]|nr:hypothetical protein J6590_052880 [Homalodisca vitripennis]
MPLDLRAHLIYNMSVASPRLIKVLALIVIILIVLQYSYTTFFEAHWIEPLFIFNSSLLARHHIYVLPMNSSDRGSANSSETLIWLPLLSREHG